jgi:transcriptional regulator with XRE-family HTH domain
MNELSRYWKLIKIDAAEAGKGYQTQVLLPAQQFLDAYFSDFDDRTPPPEQVQNQLLQWLQAPTSEASTHAGSELCLRCYVSHPILQSCLRRSRLFGPGYGFTYRDLLPFVLNDDGKSLQGNFVPFGIEILQSFCPQQSATLAGWVDLRVRRHPELNQFLLERGLHFSSDWALLNRANPQRMHGIDRVLVETFHQVYRRDRPQQHQRGKQRCPDPTEPQLQEMLQRLQAQQVSLPSAQSVLAQLKRIAEILRQEDIWGRRGSPVTEPLETTDPETGEVRLRELAGDTNGNDAEGEERSELQQFCRDRLQHCLEQSMRQAIRERIQHLEQRPRYAQLAHQVKPALRLLYFEGKSQAQIAAQLGMTSQCQVSRVLNPKELLMTIRQRTLERLLRDLLTKVQELNLVELPISPAYLKNLIQHLETFVDEQVFYAAVAELNSARNRQFNSVFADRLRQILHEQSMSPVASPIA